jgi:2-dehydro-3-deoxygluconokinase
VRRIASIGECMIELGEAGQGLMRQGYGGDTLNTAVYLRRTLPAAAGTVAYVTALGDDAFSDEMVAGWRAEGLDCGRVARLAGRLPGLYVIRTDEAGERSFLYWRSTAAARDVFAGAAGRGRLEGLAEFDCLYLSGISLAILPADDRAALLELLARRRREGALIAFDPNYRPRLWPDVDEARRVMTEAVRSATVVLPSFADEATLFGDADPGATLARLHGLGAAEVIVKDGDAPIHFRLDQEVMEALPIRVADAVDTTGAGDSFNGAYLAARLQGQGIGQAVDAASRLAALVVRHRGAIIPRDATLSS